MSIEKQKEFEKAIAEVINKFSMENESNTPDFILAQFVNTMLGVLAVAIEQRETWYGRDARPTADRFQEVEKECENVSLQTRCPECQKQHVFIVDQSAKPYDRFNPNPEFTPEPDAVEEKIGEIMKLYGAKQSGSWEPRLFSEAIRSLVRLALKQEIAEC